MRGLKKSTRTIDQNLECLRKVISNAKIHKEAGDPRRIYSQYIRYALDEFKDLPRYTSIEAEGLPRSQVIHEHVVPHSIVMEKLLELDELTNDNIMSVLNKFYIICVITKEEDKRLNALGLRSKMPEDWNEETGNVFARYQKAAISTKLS